MVFSEVVTTIGQMVNKEALTIQTASGELAATLYTPGTGGKPGTVILCHGFCGIQTVLLPAFAEFFARNGFRALTFDYRGFGASGGEKGRLVPAMQIDDIDAVVRWVAAQAFHENGPIALWGTSLGGAHVVEVAARNELVSCVISQMPFADGMSMITRNMSHEERDNLIQTLEKMQVRKQTTGKEVMVSVNKVLTDPDSTAFFAQVRQTHPEIEIKDSLSHGEGNVALQSGESCPAGAGAGDGHGGRERYRQPAGAGQAAFRRADLPQGVAYPERCPTLRPLRPAAFRRGGGPATRLARVKHGHVVSCASRPGR